MTHPPATRRARRPGTRLRPAEGVADPSRGTRVAIGIPAVAAVATALWASRSGVSLDTSLPIAVALLVVAAAASRIVVQLGPRSWYTASTPVVVLAALLGGPLLGVAAGVSTQLIRPEAVWRRRSAEGGLAALQGLAAGVVGTALLAGGNRTRRGRGRAMLIAVAVNSAGGSSSCSSGATRPLLVLWRRGVLVDLLETRLVVPLLAVLLIAEPTELCPRRHDDGDAPRRPDDRAAQP